MSSGATSSDGALAVAVPNRCSIALCCLCHSGHFKKRVLFLLFWSIGRYIKADRPPSRARSLVSLASSAFPLAIVGLMGGAPSIHTAPFGRHVASSARGRGSSPRRVMVHAAIPGGTVGVNPLRCSVVRQMHFVLALNLLSAGSTAG